MQKRKSSATLFLTLKDLKKIQNFIQSINQDFEVRICGGEPTLFKFFYELLDILYNNDFVKKNHYLF